MKRLVLLLSLALLLALAACGGAQPAGQEVLPTTEGVTGDLVTAEPIVATPAEGGDSGEVVGGNVIPVLAGTSWQWVDTTTPTETIVAVDPARYVIAFNADGTANITNDCNSVTATYTADETGALTIIPGASTAVGCPADTQDFLFLSALATATTYFAIDTGNDLYIDLAADAGTMRLQPATAGGLETAPPATTLTGTTWEWVSVIDPMGQTASADPTRYTILFNEDGSANIVADCNIVIAQYTSDGSTLMITLGPSTLVACEPGSQDQLFLSSLSSATSYTVEDGELFVEMDADAGTILFRAAGTAAGETGQTAAPSLVGTTWQWTESMTPNTATAVGDPTRYAVTFNEDGTLAITADCNSVGGAYVAGEDGTLSLTLGASTLMACPEDSQDAEFLAGLASAATYSFDGDALIIGQAADAGSLYFRAAPAAGETEAGGTAETTPTEMTLTGNVWQWVETTTPTETITVADPTRYTITFNEDGTAVIGADCNQVMATYTVADSALTIVPGATTLAMCPPDSQAGPFVVGLGAAAVYFFQDGHLYIDQFASAGTMKFAPAGAADTEAGGGAGEETAEEPGKGETTAPAGGLVGTQWQLTSITKTDGNITINDPARYAITFNADGTANLVTDCNVGGATYTIAEGNLLTITPGVSTMAFCGIGSFDQIFLGGLTNAQGYRLEEGNLLIDMLYESGTLVFVPAP